MLHPTIRRSPYFERTLRAGACDFMVYNHTYMPLDYGRDPRQDYAALVERVTLWDVGAERQAELRGPDALAFADYLAPRRLSDLGVGECRYTPVCDRAGAIMCECIVLRPEPDVVWFSHSDVDLTLWATGLALAHGDDVEVAEADVPPMQLQGPRAADVMGAVGGEAAAGLARFRCGRVALGGVDCVVSNTGWSREAGYEVYPLGSDRAPEVWDAIVAAGEPHGLLITGPIIVRAVEQGISDTQYATNSDMNPIEAGMGSMLDLDRPDFVGRDALRAVRDDGPARRTVGLVCDGDPFPVMEQHWTITAGDGEPVGVARWAVYSYALERNIVVALVDAGADPQGLVVEASDGPRRCEPHPMPFV
ncbi:MAG TPA: glycine cleavage T C-terminal barrel domain-containing protein [Gaiellales bacterium]|nr:glycine cleavage T C-terminal barrel domain-containing protein [Gaiellales bacterium]